MSDEAQDFVQAVYEAGLRGAWERTSDGSYNLGTAWWQSFFVTERSEGVWIVIEYDYDAGVDDEGKSTTSSDIWDETFASWIDAAKEVETRGLKYT